MSYNQDSMKTFIMSEIKKHRSDYNEKDALEVANSVLAFCRTESSAKAFIASYLRNMYGSQTRKA